MTPLVVRGPAPVLSWAPPRLPPASDDTMMRLLDLYRHTDPALRARARGAHAARRDRARRRHGRRAGEQARRPAGGIAQVRAYFAEAAGAAAKFLARPDGPRVGALAFDGWDTHVNEGAVQGRLADAARRARRRDRGDRDQHGRRPGARPWSRVVTEFGRTARINGTDGTDHGTGTVALLAGGALKGGRVIADWPGLKDADLHEKRDLKPTTDLRAVLKGLLRDHLRVDERALAANVFPGSVALKPMDGLIA